MSRTEQIRTNVIYTVFLVVITIGIPLLLVIGTLGSPYFMEGLFAAIISFILLASYVAYTILLGRRNS